MRATHTVTTIAAFALLTVPLAGCESSDDTSTGATPADAQTQYDGGIVAADGGVEGDTSPPDGGEPDGGELDVSEPDTGPPGPDRSISPLAKLAVCADICEVAMEECAEEVPFPDVETCQELCEADLDQDPAHLTNWTCAQQTCGADLCGFGDNGIETKLDPHPDCIDFCGLADACGGVPALNLQPGEVGVCISQCTGASLAEIHNGATPGSPTFEDVVECLSGALNDECDMAAINVCLGGEQQPGAMNATDICTFACSVIVGDPDDPEMPGCEPGSPAAEEMPDFLKCMEGCTMTNDPEQAMAAAGCLLVSGCGATLGTVAHCIDYPLEILPSCEAACETADAVCDSEEPPAGPLCPALCSGSLLNYTSVASTEEVTECMNALESCEDDGFGEMLECHGAGGPGLPGQIGTPELCTFACSIILGDPNDPENNGCAPDTPAKQEMPDILKCMESCTMTNEPGQAMASLGCLLLSDCGKSMGTVSHCFDYHIATLPSCEATCDTLSDTCPDEIPGGAYCPDFCSGGMMNIASLANEEEVASCLDAADTCQDDGFGTMLMCHVMPPEHCEATCGALNACGMNEDGGCMDGCALGFLGQSAEDAYPACIAAADGDCEAIGACANVSLPPDPGP